MTSQNSADRSDGLRICKHQVEDLTLCVKAKIIAVFFCLQLVEQRLNRHTSIQVHSSPLLFIIVDNTSYAAEVREVLSEERKFHFWPHTCSL